MMKKRMCTWVAVVAAACLLPVSAPLSALAQTTATSLPLTELYDMAVDSVHGHVFFTGGPLESTDSVVVTDADGQIDRVLHDLPGASGMVVSPDGSELFVALFGGEGIAEIDTSDLSVRRLSTGAGTEPLTVAVAAGLVWYWYQDPSPFGALGAIDPVTGTNTAPVDGQGLKPDQAHFTIRYGLWSNPVQRPNELVAASLDTSATDLQTVTVTGGSHPTLAVSHEAQIGGNIGDLAFTPDGNHIITATGSPYYHPVYSLDDLSEVDRYETDSYPDSIAVRQDGLVAAGLDAVYGPDVYMFGPDKTHPLRTYEVGGDDQRQITHGGVAFGPDGRLYVVTENVYEVAPQLLVLHPDQDQATVDLTAATTTYTYGQSGQLDVHLGTTAQGRQVQLDQLSPSGSPQRVGDATVNDQGDATFAVRPTVNTTMTASFRDAQTRIFASDSTTVTVKAAVSTSVRGNRRTDGHYALFPPGRRPLIATRVTPAQPGRHDHLERQYRQDGDWVSVANSPRIQLDETGRGSMQLNSHAPGTRMRVRAVWNGDAINAGSAGPWVYLESTD